MVTPKMIGIVAGLLLAIIIPLVLVFNMIGDNEPTTTIPTIPSTSQTTEPTTESPFGVTVPGNVFAGPEVGATDISANPTVAPQPSSKGLLCFRLRPRCRYEPDRCKLPCKSRLEMV